MGSRIYYNRVASWRSGSDILYAMKKYTVMVDDNCHHGEEKARTRMGEFDSREEAVAACKARVEDYFSRIEAGKYSFTELWQGYMMYGEDPFISNYDEGRHFSAWEYAKQRCREHGRLAAA